MGRLDVLFLASAYASGGVPRGSQAFARGGSESQGAGSRVSCLSRLVLTILVARAVVAMFRVDHAFCQLVLIRCMVAFFVAEVWSRFRV